MSCTLSVLIPTYNYGRYLPEAIDSVLSQDFTDFEVLIGDDASTDDSADVIRRYAARDSRIRIQLHSANLGLAANWNWCLQQARGKYIKYLFGDDCLASRHALGRMVALLEARPGAVLAATARFVLDDSSAVVGLWDEWRKPGWCDGPQAILRCLRANHNLIGEPSAVLFRRSAAGRGFDPGLSQIIDLEFWFHLLLQGGLVYSPEPDCAFRRHGRQQTAVNRESCVGDIETARMLTRYLEPVAKLAGLRRGSLAYRRILFRGLYYLRKKASSHLEFSEAEKRLLFQLPRPWWILCWLSHRLARPFQNWRGAVHRHRLKRTVQTSLEQRDFLATLRGVRADQPLRSDGSAPRILVIRRRYLGDIILLGSVFRSLRRHWPRAHIAVLAERAYTGVLALNPDVNAVVPIPRGAGGWFSLARTLRRQNFTWVLDFDNRWKTALIARVTGASERVALHHGPQVRLPRCYTRHEIVEADFLAYRHITDYYHRMLQAVGVPPVAEPVILTPRAADLEFVRQRPEIAGLPPGRPRLLVHPGSRSSYRVWPAAAFAEVCDRVQSEGLASVLLVAGPAEQDLVAMICEHMKTSAARLRHPLQVPQLAALFASADLLLCHDSGPMHLAAAVGTPVVALYGSQNLANWRPLGSRHTVLQPPLPCANCVSPGVCRPDDSYHNFCVRNIRVADVLAALRAQLGGAR
jgi:ADP-heptose:LPS heptosyltransferase/glycosyltransferase involved in cell wall biosynthesis